MGRARGDRGRSGDAVSVRQQAETERLTLLVAENKKERMEAPQQAGVSGKVNSFAITGDVRTPSSADTVKVAWSRSNFRASGWSEADFLKPIVTVAAPYSNNMPCNNQFKDL